MTETIAITKRENYHEIESLQPQEKDGVRLCLNCNKPIPEGNQKYCSRQCCVEFFAKNNQAGLRKYVFEREHGKCQICDYTVPTFKARPIKPEFSNPRPEEYNFPNYSKANHRISRFENLLVKANQDYVCACGNSIQQGDDCYCHFPDISAAKDDFLSNDSRCHMFCLMADDKNLGCYYREYREKHRAELICQPISVHCVNCGLKEIKEIEKSWNRDHRKAIAAFKQAYRDWDAEYTTWVKSGVLQAYQLEVEKYEADYRHWKANTEFRDFIADHIVPIAIGGPEFDLDNIQLLCDKCNKIKTARDMAKIAKFRKAVKCSAKGSQVLLFNSEKKESEKQ